MQIAVIDYGAGNLGSVCNALDALRYAYKLTDQPEQVIDAQAVIFPGVGAAADCMQKLHHTRMATAIARRIEQQKPLFAICVGMQVLFRETEEGGRHECLGIIPGSVKRLPAGLKIPHMGWNQVKQMVKSPVFRGIKDNANFYFVHSYYAEPLDSNIIAGSTEYGVNFCSMLIKGNLVATQFHPEKSGAAGLKMYSNFLEMAGGKV